MTTTTTTEKMEWLVIIPDLPGKLERRMAVRAQHLENLKDGFEGGFWKMGGAYLAAVPTAGAPLQALGSAVIALAASRDEVIQKLKDDVYAEHEVWDFDKVQIYPFKCAFRSSI
ncbi:hypothetical protein K3495_g5661 [Podosphaera aphanis]|nr:hypothetical protein K3495_g5661 [Podosphaera aphanis]